MKNRVNQAILNYSKKALPSTKKRKSKNKTPELDVERSILKTLNSLGFCVQKVESKAHYSVKSGCYRSQSAKSGTSDLIGCSPTGLGVFIEVKAPGKRKTLKMHQAIYLLERARCGAFAGCFDDVEELIKTFNEWLVLRKKSIGLASSYLEKILPINLT